MIIFFGSNRQSWGNVSQLPYRQLFSAISVDKLIFFANIVLMFKKDMLQLFYIIGPSHPKMMTWVIDKLIKVAYGRIFVRLAPALNYNSICILFLNVNIDVGNFS